MKEFSRRGFFGVATLPFIGVIAANCKKGSEKIFLSESANNIVWDSADTPWSSGDVLYMQSGQFSSVLKTSQSVLTCIRNIV